MLTKQKLPHQFSTERTIVRLTAEQDFEQFRRWSNYPTGYECFNMVDGQERLPDGRFWWERLEKSDRVFYTVLSKRSDEVIGIYGLTRINWHDCEVNNMVMRIKPEWCDKGYGSEVLSELMVTMIKQGFRKFRFDVLATNQRAIRSYEKSGFKITDDFWQEHTGAQIDFENSFYSSVKSHFKEVGDKLMVRFYYMEKSAFT